MAQAVFTPHYVHAHADLLRRAAASLSNGALSARIKALADELETENRWLHPPSSEACVDRQ
jgi:hypothetical protein